MAKYQTVPKALHSELTEYSSLIRALRTTSTLDLDVSSPAPHPQASSDDVDADSDQDPAKKPSGWTRWPLLLDDLTVPEWDLEDESSFILEERVSDSFHSFVALAASNYLESVFASIAAYTPDRKSSLQNRLEPMGWQQVLSSLTASGSVPPSLIRTVEQRLQAEHHIQTERALVSAKSRVQLAERLEKYGADEDSIFSQSKLEPQHLPIPFFYRPSDDGTDENLLILLHGLGDTHLPFSKLGTSLKLPQTAVLALRAPEQVPFLDDPGFQWYTSFDDLGELLDHPNPTNALDLMTRVITTLRDDCSWPLNRIHLFGFAQGGSVSAETGLKFRHDRLGSIVTVSAPLLSYPTLSQLSPTPVLVVHRGPPSDPADIIRAFKKGFQSVSQIKLDGGRTGMPGSREEWQHIMKFWSEKLSRRPADGVYEVFS